LEPGEYFIEMISYLYSVGKASAAPNTKWLIKVVGKDIELEQTE